ncbi:MAG: 4'-phosphopantetheinyl transferase superfamily protein [Beijerinckiaceae bacterium]|nr:MAG: 4'-phosphopantetheinyl transferase superfamily protein [Beijerinckiaceae bacterium]
MPPPDETISWIGGIDAAAAPQNIAYLADLDDPALRAAIQLPPNMEDRARAMTYGEAARERFLSRRAVLRQLLAARLGCPVESVAVGTDDFGAPRLSAPLTRVPHFLSISARGAFAAFAIAERPIGIDIEILGEPEPVPQDALHADEAARLMALNEAGRHEAFLEIWTVKEAYFKALRTGLAREPNEVKTQRGPDATVYIIDRGAQVAAQATLHKFRRRVSTTIIAACVTL